MSNNPECPIFNTKLTQEISCEGDVRFICPYLKDNGNCKKLAQKEPTFCQLTKKNETETKFMIDENKLPNLISP